jgi:hypothetical protein
LADDDVEPEVLERRVEDLLDRAVEAVDLVHEEDVVALEPRQDRGDVPLPLERRARDAAKSHTQLLAHDVREARLAETRRAHEQNVVERLRPCLRGLERDRELLLDAPLADELVEPARPQSLLELLVLLAQDGDHLLRAHAALFNASRTRSSTGSSGSVSASARSASAAE